MDLKELMEQELQHAIEEIESGGSLMPHFVAYNADDFVAVFMTPWDDEEGKDAIVAFVREKMREMKAVGYVFISEAWGVTVADGEKLPPGSLEHAPGRTEMIICDAWEGSKSYCCHSEIHRSGDKVTVERSPIKANAFTTGRMTNMLAPPEPKNLGEWLEQAFGVKN